MFVPCESVPYYLGEFYNEETFETCATEQTQDWPAYLTDAEKLHQTIEA